MRPTTRRSGAFVLLAALVAVPTGLPAAAQSSAPSQITQRHSILTELGSTGDVSSSRVFTQLTVAGDGDTTVTLPSQSTRGLRSLDSFGGPEINGDDVVWNVRATRDGTRGRTVADNTADLPVEVAVSYTLDGRDVEPSDIVGQSGRLAVTYTVTNLTAEPVEIRPTDARGERHPETVDIAVPMVGSLGLTLPPTFTNVDARGANVVGDGRGNTVVNFSLLLFSPLGDETQEVTYHANVTDAAVPGARIQVVPVDESSFASLRSTSLAYRDATDGTQRLGYGAQIIDTNLLKLADGAAQLLDGLTQLADGAEELNAGLADRAAPGARELADGLQDRAAPGARELADGLQDRAAPGARQLSDGLSSARSGGGQLAIGLSDLAAGSVLIRDGLGQAATGSGQLTAGLGALATGSDSLATGAGDLSAGIDQIAAGAAAFPEAADGIDAIYAGLQGVDAGIDRLTAAVTKIRGAVGNVPGCVPTDPSTTCGVLDGLDALDAGVRTIQGALATQIVPLLTTPGCDPLTGSDPATCGAAELAAAAATVSTSVAQGLGGAITTLEGLRDSYDGTDPAFVPTMNAVLDGLRTAQGGATSANGLADGASQKAGGAGGALTPQGPIGVGLSQLLGGVNALQNGITKVDGGNPAGENFEPGLLQALSLVRGGLSNPTCDLKNPQSATNPCGLDQVVGDLLLPGAKRLSEQLSPALRQLAVAFGTTEDPGALTGGAQALAAGAQQVADGADAAATGSGALDSGIRQLRDGSRDLAAGAGRAADGGGALSDGLRQLDDGAVALAMGIGDAASGAGELASGIGDAADGAGQLASGIGDAASGAGELADGLGDAADGSGQLADGLRQAEDGGGQIADGSVRLSEEGMGALIDGVSDAKLGAARNLETIKAVSERGRSFEGPYGTAARADSSTVWSFEVAGVGDTDGGPSTTTMALLALGALGVAGGAGTFLRRRLV